MIGLAVKPRQSILLVLLDALRVRRRHVHLHDAISVVAEGEVAVRVDETVLGKDVVMALRSTPSKEGTPLLSISRNRSSEMSRSPTFAQIGRPSTSIYPSGIIAPLPGTSSDSRWPFACRRCPRSVARYVRSHSPSLPRAQDGSLHVLSEREDDAGVLQRLATDLLGHASLLR